MIGENHHKTVHSLDVLLVRDLAGKFASRKKFVEELEHLVPIFYEHIGEHLQAWVPAPPKIERTDPIDEEPIAETQRDKENNDPQRDRPSDEDNE